MARIWMHNEMLELGDEKMSKSLGNIAPLSEVLDRWPAEVVIAFFLTSHYRSRLPFTEERMAQAEAVVERLANALRTLDEAWPPGRRRATTPTCPRTSSRAATAFFRRPRRRLRHPRGVRRPVRDGARHQPGRGGRATAGAAQLREARHELVGAARPARASAGSTPGGRRAACPTR